MNEGCLICEIASGVAPALIVASDATTVSFLPLVMEAEGHTIIAPRNHYESLLDIPPEPLADLMEVVRELGSRYRDRIGATGFNLLHASGSDAQQSLPHVHFHLIPRRPGDGLNVWPSLGPAVTDREAAFRLLLG